MVVHSESHPEREKLVGDFFLAIIIAVFGGDDGAEQGPTASR
jgi:hypothetical protein